MWFWKCNFQSYFTVTVIIGSSFNNVLGWMQWSTLVTLLLISQHWLRKWPDAIRQETITWANADPDLCGHMASLGHNELMKSVLTRCCTLLFQCSSDVPHQLHPRGHEPCVHYDQHPHGHAHTHVCCRSHCRLCGVLRWPCKISERDGQ